MNPGLLGSRVAHLQVESDSRPAGHPWFPSGFESDTPLAPSKGIRPASNASMASISQEQNDSRHGAASFSQERLGRLFAAVAVSLAVHTGILLCDRHILFRQFARQSPPTQALEVSLSSRQHADSDRHTVSTSIGQDAQLAQSNLSAANETASSQTPLSHTNTILPLPAYEYVPAKMLERLPEVIDDPGLYDPVVYEFAKQGKLVANILINEHGNVDAVIVESSSLAASFNEHVKTVFMRSRFTPGKLDGQPTKSQLRVEVKITSPD